MYVSETYSPEEGVQCGPHLPLATAPLPKETPAVPPGPLFPTAFLTALLSPYSPAPWDLTSPDMSPWVAPTLVPCLPLTIYGSSSVSTPSTLWLCHV